MYGSSVRRKALRFSHSKNLKVELISHICAGRLHDVRPLFGLTRQVAHAQLAHTHRSPNFICYYSPSTQVSDCSFPLNTNDDLFCLFANVRRPPLSSQLLATY